MHDKMRRLGRSCDVRDPSPVIAAASRRDDWLRNRLFVSKVNDSGLMGIKADRHTSLDDSPWVPPFGGTLKEEAGRGVMAHVLDPAESARFEKEGR